jgi:hypothetical protein
VLERAARVGTGFVEAGIAVQVFVMGALGENLPGGEQGHCVVWVVFENVACHLKGFARVVGVLVESHGLLEEKRAQFTVRKFLGKIVGSGFELSRIGEGGGSLVGVEFCLRLCRWSFLGRRRGRSGARG